MTKTRKTRRRGHGRDVLADGDWLAGAVEVPRAGTVATEKMATRQRWYRRIIWAALAMLVVTLLVLIGLAGQIATMGQPEADTDNELPTSEGRVVATAHLEQWLAGDPAPLPGGKLISWDGAVDVPVPAPDGPLEDADHDFTVEVDRFSVVDGQGRAYRAAVQVAVDPRGGAKVLNGPSLSAAIPPADDTWVPAGPWPGREPGQVPDPVRQAVEGWAGAYVSGSSSALRLTVGDPDPDHTYIPLSGLSSVEVHVPAAFPVWGEDGKPSGSNVQPKRIVARVSMTLDWDSRSGNASAGESSEPVVMDVLVERADTASPVVTAWGGAGEGPLLERYQNAVAAGGRDEITEPPAATPQATPSKEETKQEDSPSSSSSSEDQPQTDEEDEETPSPTGTKNTD